MVWYNAGVIDVELKKETVKAVPTQDQEMILAQMCREDMPTFDKLPLEAQECWIGEYWEKKRFEGVWNISTMLVVSYIEKTEGVKLENEENDILMRECQSIVNNYPNNFCSEFLQERLSKYNPLLIGEDYVQLSKEHIDFRNSVEKV